MSGKFHFNSTSTGDDGVGPDGACDNHNCVVQGTFSFFNVLGGTTTDDDGDSLGIVALSEHVEPFISELDFFKLTALAHYVRGQGISSSLNLAASCFSNALQIINWDTASTKNVSISEVLGSKVTNREF